MQLGINLSPQNLMQSLNWYAQRLRVMTAGELAWRMQSAIRDTAEYYCCTLGHPRLPRIHVPSEDRSSSPAFRLTDIQVGEWSDRKSDQMEYRWYRRLMVKADRIVRHQMSFFDLKNVALGNPINWNFDYKHNLPAPMRFSALIDYRDFKITGDAKFVWEPNRHHHLVVLARAFRASGSKRYAMILANQLTSWLDQCPFGIGMNWRSPLELAVRLINWVWAIDLTRESGIFTGEFRERLLKSIYLHLWEITRKYSRGSSTNNHLVGEAAGVFIAANYFTELEYPEEWILQSRNILCREIQTQTYPDGGSREQALGYQFFVMQFFLLAGLVGLRAGKPFPDAYWDRLEKVFEFIHAFCHSNARPMLFGDCDDGYVLDLGSSRDDLLAWMPVASVIFNRPDFARESTGYSEPARWLLERENETKFTSSPAVNRQPAVTSRAFPDSGYYLLQYSGSRPNEAISVVFDCGELGLKPMAGHGHADALSITLHAFGENVFVDPGTYDYFSYPSWREYFRSTRAHNTAVVDGENQSVIQGPFLWGAAAKAACRQWSPTTNGGTVVGEHDGYTRLKDPVLHCRMVELDGRSRQIVIQDRFTSLGHHQVSLYLHLAEQCRIVGVGPDYYIVDFRAGRCKIIFDHQLTVQTMLGCEDPIGGWVSYGYHQKVPTTTFIATGFFHRDLIVETRVEISD